MASFLRLEGGATTLNMDLVTRTEVFDDGIAVYVLSGTAVIYKGKHAARIEAWLAKNGVLPIIAPEPNP